MEFKIRKTQTVEIIVDDLTKSEFEFPKQLSVLNKAVVQAISAHKVTDIALSPTNKRVVADVPFRNSYVRLRTRNSLKDEVNNLSLNELHVPSNDGKLKIINDLKIDFSQSLILIKDTTGLAVGDVFLLTIYFEDESVC